MLKIIYRAYHVGGERVVFENFSKKVLSSDTEIDSEKDSHKRLTFRSRMNKTKTMVDHDDQQIHDDDILVEQQLDKIVNSKEVFHKNIV